MSDQHKIKFLDKKKISEKVSKSNTVSRRTIDQLSEEQKSKKLSNKDNGMMTTQHIFSARTGEITNDGGPSKYIKSESANTVWNSDKISEVSTELDSRIKTIQEKAEVTSNKRELENKRMNELTESLKSTIQDKVSSISPAGILCGTNYKVSENTMSIFDSKDFIRLQDKTDGEKVSEDIKTKKEQVDESWRNGGKIVSSKDITQKMFDGFFMKKEE